MVALLPLFQRANECPSGYLYYTCSASNFAGCCSVNACHVDDGCPVDKMPPSSTTKKTTPTTVMTVGPPVSSSTKVVVTSKVTQTSQVVSTERETVTATASPSLPTDAEPAASTSAPPPPVETEPTDSGSSGISSGAIAGIVVGVVAALLLVAALIFFRIWKRRKARKDLESESRRPPGGPVMPEEGEQAGGGSSSSPLFGEVSSGGLAGAMAKWGMKNKHSSADTKDFAGIDVYKKESSSPIGAVQQDQVAELDGGPGTTAPLPELESPEQTPMIGTTQTPSPALSGAGSQNAPTFVSSWRNSSRTVASPGISSMTVTPELDSTPRMASVAEMPGATTETIANRVEAPDTTSSGTPPAGTNEAATAAGAAVGTTPGTTTGTATAEAAVATTKPESAAPATAPAPAPAPESPVLSQQPTEQSPAESPSGSGPTRTPTTDRPRATLNLTQTERTKGAHIGSWDSYNA